MENREDRGLVLKWYRKQFCKTQKELADYLGVKINTYSQYENNKRNVSLDILCALVLLYGKRFIYVFLFDYGYNLRITENDSW